MVTRALPTFSVSILAATLFITGCSSDTPHQGDAAVPDQAQFMITMNADMLGEDRDGKSFITFTNPSGVTLFTERPLRAAIPVSAESVVATWQLLSFSSNPPNASVMIAGQDPVIITLNNPAWTSQNAIRMEIVKPIDTNVSGDGSIVIDASDVVNSQVTDSITQTNVEVLGEAPAIAMGNLYSQTAQALNQAVARQTDNQQADVSAESGAISSIASDLVGLSNGQGVPGATTPTD